MPKTDPLTPLVPAPELALRYGAGRLWLKLEYAHPTGVHKHRSAVAIVRAALAVGYKSLALGTCGNAGLALAPVARAARLKLFACVPARYSGGVVAAMEAEGAEVIRTPGGYEEAVEVATSLARKFRHYDAGPTGAGGAVSLAAYGDIAREIVAAMLTIPDSVWVPVGNGTTYAGIGQCFVTMAGAPGQPARFPPPRMGAAGSVCNTAAVRGIVLGEVVELPAAGLVETPENEPLLNWRSAHAAEALAVAQATGGLAEELTDAKLVRTAAELAEAGFPCHPSGAAGVAGLARALAAGKLAPGDHVAILTASSTV